MDTQNGEEATQQEQQAGRNTYPEHVAMVVTELVSQSPMGWLKAAAPYSSTSRDEWPCPVSVETSRTYTKR